MFFSKSKKGNVVLGGVAFLIIILGFAFVSLLGGYIYGLVNDEVQTDTNINADIRLQLQEGYESYLSVFDYGLAFALVVLWLFMLVSAFLLDTDARFFIFSFILLICYFVAIPILANVFLEISAVDLFTSTISQLPITSWVFNNLVIIILIVSLSVGGVLFAKFKQ